MKKTILAILLAVPCLLLAQKQTPSYPAKQGRIHLDTIITLSAYDATRFLVAADAWFTTNFPDNLSAILKKTPTQFTAEGNYNSPTFLGNANTHFWCCAKIQLDYLGDNRLRVQFYDYRIRKNGGYWKAEHWITDEKVFKKNGKMRYVKGEFRTKLVQSLYDHLDSLEDFLAGR